MDAAVTENEGIEDSNTSITEELISMEKLDRASPEMWPDEGITRFVSQNLAPNENPPWTPKITEEDRNQMYNLGSLSVYELILEVKRLHDIAYQLGVEESKEMTRGKFLDIFTGK
ncbi:hypothetical protein QAD02_019303 [Eretmocerus hayati]|uniref:Uncharacterized protein n=1 Tax=Eretmocerus hayati TaxID=131215 RepID=A0ACC2PJ77_9HYME|nr:hypothetical protein QAD02_019303 [Eretmocerus hayati]